MIKSMSHLDESSFEMLIDDLVTRFVTKCSDDKISDLLEYVELMMTSSDDYGPITILVCQLISVLSYHPSHVDKFRRPRNLSSLDCAPELEDSKLLKSVIFRFQLLGKRVEIIFCLSEFRIQLVVNFSGILISGLQWIRNSFVMSEGFRIYPFLVVSLASTIGKNVRDNPIFCKIERRQRDNPNINFPTINKDLGTDQIFFNSGLHFNS